MLSAFSDLISGVSGDSNELSITESRGRSRCCTSHCTTASKIFGRPLYYPWGRRIVLRPWSACREIPYLWTREVVWARLILKLAVFPQKSIINGFNAVREMKAQYVGATGISAATTKIRPLHIFEICKDDRGARQTARLESRAQDICFWKMPIETRSRKKLFCSLPTMTLNLNRSAPIFSDRCPWNCMKVENLSTNADFKR